MVSGSIAVVLNLWVIRTASRVANLKIQFYHRLLHRGKNIVHIGFDTICSVKASTLRVIKHIPCGQRGETTGVETSFIMKRKESKPGKRDHS